MSQSNQQRRNRIRIEKIITFTVQCSPKYKCSICAKAFQTMTSYRKHKESHSSQKAAVFKCRKCAHGSSKPLSRREDANSNKSTQQRNRLRERNMPRLTKSQTIREFDRYDSSTDDSDLEQ